MLKVTVVVGNPKPKSRTAHIAEQLVRQYGKSSDRKFRI
jgi:hypothetical protein